MLVARSRDVSYVRAMPPLKKTLLPIVVTAVAAALFLPSAASAQRCENNPKLPQCRTAEKFRERSDQQKGITPACRAAADRYKGALRELSGSKSAIGPWRNAVKKAKSDRAKAKAKKGLAKARKRYKAAKKVNTVQLKSAADSACAGAQVKPI